MRPALIFAQVLSAISICWAQTPKPQERIKAEYYLESYAHRYKVLAVPRLQTWVKQSARPWRRLR